MGKMALDNYPNNSINTNTVSAIKENYKLII